MEEMAGAEERSRHFSVIRLTCVCLSRCVCTEASVLLHSVSALDSNNSFLFFLYKGRRKLFLHKDMPLSGVERRFISIDVDRQCPHPVLAHPVSVPLFTASSGFLLGEVTPSPEAETEAPILWLPDA